MGEQSIKLISETEISEMANKHFDSGQSEKELAIARIGFIEGFKISEKNQDAKIDFLLNKVVENLDRSLRSSPNGGALSPKFKDAILRTKDEL